MTDMKSHTLLSRTREFLTGVAVAGRLVGSVKMWKSSAWARLARGCREKIFARERGGFGGRMILGGLNGEILAPPRRTWQASRCFDFSLVNETERKVELHGKSPGFTPPRFNLSMCL
jgi:hypothetical protein